MAKKHTGLGRGLGEIFNEITTAYENEIPSGDAIDSIPIIEIQTNPYQPRKSFNQAHLQELSDSIKRHGLLQPIVVVRELDGYTLVAGERRLRASQLADLTHIKATVVDVDISKFHELALIENIQREDLNPVELALSYAALLEQHGLTHDELSSTLHKSRTQITNTLRLLTLGEKAKDALIGQSITQGHAKILVGLEIADQEVIVDAIIADRLSVRDVEQMVKTFKSDTAADEKPVAIEKVAQPDPIDLAEVADAFKSLGIKVALSKNSCKLNFDNEYQVLKLVKQLGL